MQLNQSTIQPRKGHQPDRYQGKVDPKSKLRHGEGNYNFPNSFFKYSGQYQMGVKNGNGILKTADGTTIRGKFVNNQLFGEAEINYPDGASYRGNLQLGQKHGFGVFDSIFQNYEGQWNQNRKQGKGVLKNKTNSSLIQGEFKNNKPHGNCEITKFAYSFEGEMQNGVKNGKGIQKDCSYQGFQYEGQYKNDKFEGDGHFKAKNRDGMGYQYKGQFQNGAPNPQLFPNQFRVRISSNKKQEQNLNESDTMLISKESPLIEYQLETQSINIYVESVFQGPQKLDDLQPTQQEIDQMIKNWQNQNKKNKNPPPMPDFNQPKMKKPDLVLIDQQSQRNIEFRLLKIDGQKQDAMKVDYRKQIAEKRRQNQQLKSEALKKADQDGNKKGGKKDTKGQIEYKVNAYVQNPPQKSRIINVINQNGIACLRNFELPDDFPPGKYYICISSSYKTFGEIAERRIQLNVKGKQLGKKK